MLTLFSCDVVNAMAQVDQLKSVHSLLLTEFLLH